MQNRDQDAVSALADGLRPERTSAFAEIFRTHGAREPTILWDPSLDDIDNPLLRQFHSRCTALAVDGGIRMQDFRLEDFRGLEDWMTLLDVEADGRVFRYRHFGDGIANIRGLKLLGQTTQTLGGHIALFFDAVFRAALQHRLPVFTVHEPPKAIFALQWSRLIFPLLDESGDIRQFLVMTLADNELRAGLEIIPDPVLIVDRDQIIRFANRAARESFGRELYLGSEVDLFQFAGIDIELPATPEEMARSETVRDVVSLAIRGTMIERFHLTVSGTAQWGCCFYVITLRPATNQTQVPVQSQIA
ncbi:hypothetical protein AIOL_003693 [Candidatus Rhodobacter oscarellae]|uniref:PAS domain-containing protein n=1 Tax=Candidatus Rhodobacter oscarellae TaxID=1675527 RepID=A0A0J9EAM6_9RHOB|nr:PAS domain-containing protein [Candidatus Rhodobacter lobularis]KMW58714.1 hypothetical protein AIOL_003693 [Candidatus Rhodobacter lobularis]